MAKLINSKEVKRPGYRIPFSKERAYAHLINPQVGDAWRVSVNEEERKYYYRIIMNIELVELETGLEMGLETPYHNIEDNKIITFREYIKKEGGKNRDYRQDYIRSVFGKEFTDWCSKAELYKIKV